ncbi:MAG TPA: FAD-dependent oxidoreductase, partial [Bradyrhizobium sp.]
TLVHLMDRLLERQLDAPAAELLKSLVERKGIKVLLNANTARLHGETRVEGVELADGRRIDADAVIFAAGIRPSVALAKDAGIPVNRGIVVDDHLVTSTSDVFAIGECAEHRGVCYGLVEPTNEQARALAERLAGRDARSHPQRGPRMPSASPCANASTVNPLRNIVATPFGTRRRPFD